MAEPGAKGGMSVGWSKGIIEHKDKDGLAYLSIPFTWNLPDAYQRAVWLGAEGHDVIAGGPAVDLMPEYLAGVARLGVDWPGALQRHNPDATRTSVGCIRHCSFCAVWRTEGKLRELDDWPDGHIISDNNLLACSLSHFDKVVDRLKSLSWCDFNGGLDARLLTKYHAERIAELKKPLIHMAFDHIKTEERFLRAFQLLRDAGIPAKQIRVFVLFGFKDTPEDTLYRMRLVQSLGSWPNPQRYNPLDTLVRNSYVDPNWTEYELKRYHRYWSRLAWLEHIPFEEYRG